MLRRSDRSANGQRSTEKQGSDFPPTTIDLSQFSSAPSSMTNSLSPHPTEDWDRTESSADSSPATTSAPAPSRVVFPSRGGAADDERDAPTPDALPSHSHRAGCPGKRTLSQLLKLHAEKGTDVHFTSDEAARLEDLLGQWVRFFSPFPPSIFLSVG